MLLIWRWGIGMFASRHFFSDIKYICFGFYLIYGSVGACVVYLRRNLVDLVFHFFETGVDGQFQRKL